ncbi:bifunctional riboflavin kinase/FAD synthetase [Synechococcus sp. CS-1329]|uniref:bifunctional riboflavin kinase/FAD synthetase n=1 Tax=Synechococcus sp. CS-1329 TaxID=2847975 RepID=UPI00287FFDA9|nr:bifunctional riboflavin kinase/FAD synthetase [Synechococcus sp. CS-1329]MCT0218017.1 bifunctional riboflavin kinase/FAD synthetase [Synechococcus sp. CS-1329]
MIPLRSPQEAMRPTAVALGSFDGLHQGHRRVIAAVAAAPTPGLVPTVVSFWPHPRELLYGEPRLRLDLPGEKLALLEPYGIRQLVLVPFTRQLSLLSPEAFIEQVLVGELQAREVAVGENFRFGHDRSGDTTSLRQIGERHGLRVLVSSMLWDGSERISSSRIRRALAAGAIDEANRLLERPYRFSGRVVRGRGLGRQLSWPTANLQVDGRKFLPQEGVYAAWVRTTAPTLGGEALQACGQPMAAVMNLGPQPTVDPLAPSAVEVHLLDREIELVGRDLEVEPLQLLRHQQRFAGLEELSRQIGVDAAQARLLLKRGSAGGVGVAQTPADESSDPPQQQNS